MKRTDFPLSAFLAELETEDDAFRLTVADYDRIRRSMIPDPGISPWKRSAARPPRAWTNPPWAIWGTAPVIS